MLTMRAETHGLSLPFPLSVSLVPKSVLKA